MRDMNRAMQMMGELRGQLQAMEWDMQTGKFNNQKMNYYKRMLAQYEHLKNLDERS